MTDKLNQIYHVARCGSTLLAALLSGAETTYSEPFWGHQLRNDDFPPEDIEQFHGSIVKFSSINTSVGFKPNGPKVFLYRPLSQYLEKMDQCGRDWLDIRKQIYGPVFDKIRGIALKDLYPENAMQLHTIFWASCVIEMQKTEDVMWIKSNDFFADKEATARQVLAYFGKDGNPDMRFADVNVKEFRLNGGAILPFEEYEFESEHMITKTHGVIETNTIDNDQIQGALKWAADNIPIEQNLYY